MKSIVTLFFFISLILTNVATAQEKTMNIQNEYDTLKKVMVGNCTNLIVPQSLPDDLKGEKTSLLNKLFFNLYKGKKAPRWLVKALNEEQNDFINVLKKYDVEIIRPEIVEPLPDEEIGLGQMYVRDPAFIVGDNLFFGKLFSPERRKETRGFVDFEGNIKSNKIFKLDNKTELITAFIEGGDVIVDYPYVFIGVSNIATNLEGIKWLQLKLGEKYKIIPLEFTDKSILHLDCIITIIGNNKGIIHKNSLKSPLPYPLNEYDFIEVDNKTRKELGTNVFVINPTTVIVQKRHKKLQNDLLSKGYKVEIVKFNSHSDLGGAFRCVTFPILRTEK